MVKGHSTYFPWVNCVSLAVSALLALYPQKTSGLVKSGSVGGSTGPLPHYSAKRTCRRVNAQVRKVICAILT